MAGADSRDEAGGLGDSGGRSLTPHPPASGDRLQSPRGGTQASPPVAPIPPAGGPCRRAAASTRSRSPATTPKTCQALHGGLPLVCRLDAAHQVDSERRCNGWWWRSTTALSATAVGSGGRDRDGFGEEAPLRPAGARPLSCRVGERQWGISLSLYKFWNCTLVLFNCGAPTRMAITSGLKRLPADPSAS